LRFFQYEDFFSILKSQESLRFEPTLDMYQDDCSSNFKVNGENIEISINSYDRFSGRKSLKVEFGLPQTSISFSSYREPKIVPFRLESVVISLDDGSQGYVSSEGLGWERWKKEQLFINGTEILNSAYKLPGVAMAYHENRGHAILAPETIGLLPMVRDNKVLQRLVGTLL
jgi:hypothetical protein